MNNNDVLRRVRYTFDFDDEAMMAMFNDAGLTVTRSEVSNWLKRDDDPFFKELDDPSLAYFLNGFINLKRGKREGPGPPIEEKMTNNIVLRKLKIALNLKDSGMLELLARTDMFVGKHELSAFFRKPTQPQYRVCQDQILRRFLHGMQLAYRVE